MCHSQIYPPCHFFRNILEYSSLSFCDKGCTKFHNHTERNLKIPSRVHHLLQIRPWIIVTRLQVSLAITSSGTVNQELKLSTTFSYLKDKVCKNLSVSSRGFGLTLLIKYRPVIKRPRHNNVSQKTLFAIFHLCIYCFLYQDILSFIFFSSQRDNTDNAPYRLKKKKSQIFVCRNQASV